MSVDSLTVQFRFLANEDFMTSSTPAQINQDVLGVGTVPLTPFVLAAGDAAAAAAGVQLGEVFMDSSVNPNRLRVRLS